MDLICVTCLSADRKLVPLNDISYLGYDWSDFNLKLSDEICWECKAQFDNIWRFKQRVIQAQEILNNKNKNTDNIKPLSNLSVCDQNLIIRLAWNEEDEEFQDFANDDSLKIFPKEEPASLVEVKEEFFVKEESKHIDTQTESNTKIVRRENRKNYICYQMTEEEMLKAREADRCARAYVEAEFKCEHCFCIFESKKIFDSHSRIHAVTWGDFMCPICCRFYQTEELLQKHKCRHYVMYKCVKCSHKENKKNNIIEHYRTKHEDKEVVCKRCKLKFSTFQERHDHCLTKHKNVHPCNICYKHFKTPCKLENHLLNHTTRRNKATYNCDYCAKVFHYKRSLEAHILSHGALTERAYCVECNLLFKNETTYKVHLKQSVKHMPPENFKYECTVCDKKFYCKTTHRRHMNAIHYNIREFSCDICPKSFIRRDQLTKHMMYTHQGVDKPREKICPHCGKGFHKQQTLLNHIRTHTGEKPFECKLCDACFSQKNTLTSHVRSVHMKMPRKRKFGVRNQ